MYYILDKDYSPEPGPYSARYDGSTDDWEVTDFIMGRKLELTLHEPIEIRLYEYEEGDIGIPDYFKIPFPIMSEEMIKTLESAGVDNLQVFPVILKNAENNLCLENYKVVNVVGVIEAADMNKSDYIDMGGTGKIAVGFRNLVIDESKAKNALMFRLAESLSTILIHEKVKEALENSSLKYLRYLPCIEYEEIDDDFNVDDYNWDD